MSAQVKQSCSQCGMRTASKTGMCQSCLRWSRYWASLTPVQQRAVLAMMDARVAEREGRRRR